MSAEQSFLEQRRPGKAKVAVMSAYAVVAWFALALQFYLLMVRALASGGTLIGAVITYFSFFTVLTNTIAALVVTVLLSAPESNPGRWAAHPRVQSGIAAAMALVGIAYELLLRHTWNPQGLQLVADVILHDVMPVSYVLYWAVFVSKAACNGATSCGG